MSPMPATFTRTGAAVPSAARSNALLISTSTFQATSTALLFVA
jgi:hypothetical protein